MYLFIYYKLAEDMCQQSPPKLLNASNSQLPPLFDTTAGENFRQLVRWAPNLNIITEPLSPV